MDAAALKRLSEHKYSCVGTSLLDPYFQPFWKMVVEWVPMWVAPNLLTVVGLAVNVAASFLLFWFSPQAAADAAIPAWLPALVAATVFAYQTLDAIDGKQARRTGSSSPLGELFDHGCDAVTCGLVVLAALTSMGAGGTPLFFAISVMATTMFYMAHWQTYVKGSLFVQRIDVTEAQLVLMALHLITACTDVAVWGTPVVAGFTLRDVSLTSSLAMSVSAMFNNLQAILEGGPGENGMTVANTSVLSPLIPLLLHLASVFYITSFPCFAAQPTVVFLALTCASAKITMKLIVAAMSKSKLPQLDDIFLPAVVFFVNAELGSVIPDAWMLYFLVAYNLYSFSTYCYTMINTICGHLRIECFRITPKPPAVAPAH